MFKGRKELQPKFYWIRETNFIRRVIAILQKAVDDANGNCVLQYEQRYCLPEKFWEIAIQYPGNKDPHWIEAHSDKLIKAFKTGDSIERSVQSILKGKERELKISYVLCDDYGGMEHAVLIYWQRR